MRQAYPDDIVRLILTRGDEEETRGTYRRPEALRCSFCGKSQDKVVRLVAGQGVYICDECVDLCTQIIAEELDLKGARDAVARRTSGDTPQR